MYNRSMIICERERDTELNISFRPVTPEDLPLVSEWQTAPEVRQWFGGKEYTPREQIETHYRNELTEVPRRTWHFIIRLDGTDSGFIQTYLLSSYSDFNRLVQAEDGTAMADIFLAAPFMHKGFGSEVMRAFLRDYVFSGKLFTADKCAIGPEPKNLSAIRMYEKAGFKWIRTIQVPSEDEPEYKWKSARLS